MSKDDIRKKQIYDYFVDFITNMSLWWKDGINLEL